jgi:hypothetical protein
MRGWTWRFEAEGDALHGTLANPAAVVWRRIEVRRAP